MRVAALSFVVACGAAPSVPATHPTSADGSCANLDDAACKRAKGLLGAASTFSSMRTELILDATSSLANGRGLVRGADGLWTPIPTQCAKPSGGAQGRAVDASQVDFGYVGIAVDSTLLGADIEVAPYFAAGAQAGVHTLRLVAVAYVRDLDPQFFDAAEDVSYASDACACRGATHFVGAVKMGGMLAYDVTVKEGEAHGKALDFFKAHFSARDAVITETRAGELEVDGLEEQLAGARQGAAKPLRFRVKNPVPIAYAVYPIHDVCKFSFPEPEVSPVSVDFGAAPYGKPAQRLVHVVNRASFDLAAQLGKSQATVPARGTADVPVEWVPMGDATGCDVQSREESMVFAPRPESIPVTPKQHSVRVQEIVRTGKPSILRAEHVDTGEARRPEYATTQRDWSCPPDYVIAGCRAQSAACGDKNKDCTSDGYVLTAEPRQNGCHFGCAGPSSILLASNYCRFDAVMECKLSCR